MRSHWHARSAMARAPLPRSTDKYKAIKHGVSNADLTRPAQSSRVGEVPSVKGSIISNRAVGRQPGSERGCGVREGGREQERPHAPRPLLRALLSSRARGRSHPAPWRALLERALHTVYSTPMSDSDILCSEEEEAPKPKSRVLRQRAAPPPKQKRPVVSDSEEDEFSEEEGDESDSASKKSCPNPTRKSPRSSLRRKRHPRRTHRRPKSVDVHLRPRSSLLRKLRPTRGRAKLLPRLLHCAPRSRNRRRPRVWRRNEQATLSRRRPKGRPPTSQATGLVWATSCSTTCSFHATTCQQAAAALLLLLLLHLQQRKWRLQRRRSRPAGTSRLRRRSPSPWKTWRPSSPCLLRPHRQPPPAWLSLPPMRRRTYPPSRTKNCRPCRGAPRWVPDAAEGGHS